jgi:hypothetical protein
MLAAHWLSLWLGFYLLSRRPRPAARILLAFAFISLSTYFLSTAFLVAPEPVPGDQVWGVWVLLHAFLKLTGERLPGQRLVLVVVYGAAALMYALSTHDSLVWRYSMPAKHATVDVNGSISPGPLYALYFAQMAATLALGSWS